VGWNVIAGAHAAPPIIRHLAAPPRAVGLGDVDPGSDRQTIGPPIGCVISAGIQADGHLNTRQSRAIAATGASLRQDAALQGLGQPAPTGICQGDSRMSRSAFTCAIFSRSPVETGKASRNARARALEANG